MTLVQLEDVIKWLEDNITNYIDEMALEYFDEHKAEMVKSFPNQFIDLSGYISAMKKNEV